MKGLNIWNQRCVFFRNLNDQARTLNCVLLLIPFILFYKHYSQWQNGKNTVLLYQILSICCQIFVLDRIKLNSMLLKSSNLYLNQSYQCSQYKVHRSKKRKKSETKLAKLDVNSFLKYLFDSQSKIKDVFLNKDLQLTRTNPIKPHFYSFSNFR